jgi:hypothetical protein
MTGATDPTETAVRLYEATGCYISDVRDQEQEEKGEENEEQEDEE